MIRRSLACLSSVAVVSALTSITQADDTWGNAAGGDWSIASNWLSGLPKSTDSVYIGYVPGPTGAFTTTFSTGSLSVVALFSRDALTISGGVLTLTSAFSSSTVSGSMTVSGGTLDVASTLTSSAGLNWSGGAFGGKGKVSVTGPMSFLAGTGLQLQDTVALRTSGTTTWSGSDVTMASGASFNNLSGAKLVVSSDQLLSGGTFTNAGTMVKQGTAGTTNVSSAFTNSGTVTVNSGTLELSGTSFTNTGTVQVSGAGSELLLTGSYKPSTLGKLTTSTGGAIELTGSLTMEATAWDCNAYGTGAGFVLNGATISGSSVGDEILNSKLLKFAPGSINTLHNIEADGIIEVGNNSTLHTSGNVYSGANAFGSSAAIIVDQGSTLNLGGVDLSSGINNGSFTNNGSVTTAGAVNWIDTAYANVPTVNNGSVTVDNGSSLTINIGLQGQLVNNGSAVVRNGSALTLYVPGPYVYVPWTNSGSITVDGTSSLQIGGYTTPAAFSHISLASGAKMKLGGWLDLGGSTLDLAAYPTGTWSLAQYGGFKNGTVLNQQLLTIPWDGIGYRFDNVTIPGRPNWHIVAEFDNGMSFPDGLELKDSYISSRNWLTVGDNIQFDLTSMDPKYNATVVYLGQDATHHTVLTPSALLHGTSITFSEATSGVDNYGICRAESSPGEMMFSNGLINNYGTFEATNGGILEVYVNATLGNFSNGVLTGGTFKAGANSLIKVGNLDVATNDSNIVLTGSGSAIQDQDGNDALRHLAVNQGSLTLQQGRSMTLGQSLSNSGSVTLGSSSTLTTTGYTQSASGALAFSISDVAAAAQAQRLVVNGNVSLAGLLEINDLSGFVPTYGDTYTILTYTGSLTGSFGKLSDTKDWIVIYQPHQISVQAVPEPATLIALGLGMAMLSTRRKRAVSS